MNTIDGIQAFINVADSGSFAAAARRLNISPSAVSKLISRTESEFGARLLNRNTRGLSLTLEGEAFLERCRTIINELESAKSELSNFTNQPTGKLRISLPNMPSFFGPIISRFIELYPTIDLEVDLSDRIVDVIDEGFDVVVRAGNLVDSRLKVRPISKFEMNLTASPAYLSKFGKPIEIEQLKNHKCISYRYPSTGRIETWVLTNPQERLPEMASPVACNSTDLRLSMALLGNGIVLLPRLLTDPHLKAGRLVLVLEAQVSMSYEMNVVWPANRQSTPRLRAFIDYMADHFDRVD